MAGIAGWIARGKGPEEAALPAMLEAIAHRGSEGLCGYVDRARGRELMMGAAAVDEQARVALVVDGIADAHALLRAYLRWDRAFIRDLRGQFALAVWDGRKERLLLARDRFGEKPLYLYEKGGVFAFASEPKALRKAFRLEADPEAMSQSVARYKDVRKLGPATHLVWQFGRQVETRYWLPPDGEPFHGEPVSGAVEAFAGELADAVHVRPAGAIFLSGGLDSAALVALASRNGAKLHTFSFALEGDRNSELSAAAEVAKQFGTAHHEVMASAKELAEALPEVIAMRDAPAARASDLALHRLAKAARGTLGNLQRVLTGEGCDEVLGGYRRYILERLKGGNLRKNLYAAQTGPRAREVVERTEGLCAAAGVESGQPFLDHRLAETVSALPDEMRLRGTATKWILREASRELLPQMTKRRHGGFRVSARDVLSKELLLDYLGSGNARVRQYTDTATLDRMLKEHVDGKGNHEASLWTLLNLEIWHRRCASG